MIHYIKGNITQILPGKVVIENNSIGFEVNVTDTLAASLGQENDIVTLYTFMAVSEDDISLYGFADEDTLKMFKLLTTVSGIGNKGALAILSKLGLKELRQAIVFEDAESISKAKGIGKKTAAKLVLELKDKVGVIDASDDISVDKTKVLQGSAKAEAILALQSLGFSKSEAMSYLVGVNDENLTVEEYIKIALRSRR